MTGLLFGKQSAEGCEVEKSGVQRKWTRVFLSLAVSETWSVDSSRHSKKYEETKLSKLGLDLGRDRARGRVGESRSKTPHRMLKNPA